MDMGHIAPYIWIEKLHLCALYHFLSISWEPSWLEFCLIADLISTKMMCKEILI